MLRPSLEEYYGSEVWECNKSQAIVLESIQLSAAKKMIGCSSKTCNEAVRGNMGLEALKTGRDRAKLNWWYKVNKMTDDRYPKWVLEHEWDVESCRGKKAEKNVDSGD